jgi:hypothetical protein
MNSTIKVRTIALALRALLIFLHAKNYAMMHKPTGGSVSEQKMQLNHFCHLEKTIIFTKFTEYAVLLNKDIDFHKNRPPLILS